MLDWIRFAVTAVLLISGVAAFACAVIGASRFGFVMNRLHAAGIGDTMGLFFTALGLIIATGFAADSLKILLLIFFMWFTSPVSTHFVAQVEYFTNKHLEKYVTFRGEAGRGTDNE
ncbi:MAG: monovalent cation/H(+) antiporter subunit G [Lachnospiraceae bacterium]|nr:monovalent cation/H(+) antiporter subunit G [Lachnospiraceae bacterium]